MRKPPKGDIWWFVDRLGKADGKHWALSYWEGDKCRYVCVKAVICSTMTFTQCFTGKQQPRAVIVIPKGTIRICDDFAYVS